MKIKTIILSFLIILFSINAYCQTSDPGVTSTGNAGGNHSFVGTFSNGTFSNWMNTGQSATAYNLIGNSNQHAGFGVVNGPDIVSPVIWMYTTPRNAFTVRTMPYNGNIASGSDLFTVRSSGKVGLEISDPLAKLHLKHLSYLSDQVYDPSTSILVENNSNAWRTSTGIRFKNYKGNFTVGMYGSNDNVNNSFRIYNKEEMNFIISQNGNVGIGVTTIYPDEKLTVKGKIHAQEVRVDLNGSVAPDYVFEENYNLKSLQEIETYINKNKHLPEVPSAKEMETDGVYLKKMNLLLLKKIEELTLYLIEQNKRIEKLELENNKSCNSNEK